MTCKPQRLGQVIAQARLESQEFFGQQRLAVPGSDPRFQILNEYWSEFLAAFNVLYPVVPRESGDQMIPDVNKLIAEGFESVDALAAGPNAGDKRIALLAAAKFIEAGVKMGNAITTAERLSSDADKWERNRTLAHTGREARLRLGEEKRRKARAIGEQEPGISLTACAKRVAAQFNGELSESGIREVIKPLFAQVSDRKWRFRGAGST